jgi:hypothetical protein
VEKALNGRVLSVIQFYTILSTYLFYADYKWIFSVYAPPRFWEAAQAKVINVVPRRTNDQSYFPEMKEGDHYITFDEDFSDLDNLKDIKKEKFEHITNETKALYDKWIHGTQYGISENLIKHILEEIENANVV